MTAVSARGLTVRFPRRARPSLQGVDLDVAQGGQHLLLGPSGAGKSTLLRVLAGVVPGTVHAEVSGAVTAAGSVGYVQQNPHDALCLPDVDSEVAFALECAGVSTAEARDRVPAALAAVGAAQLRDRDPATLSGGEAQRVALAAVLVGDPDVVVVDEPTAMLDPAAARSVAGLVARRGRAAVVLAEHRLDLGAPLPDTVTVLDAQGRVVACGPTAHVLQDTHALLEAQGCWLPLSVRAAAHGRAAALEHPHTYRRERRSTPGAALLGAAGMGVRSPDGVDLVRDVDLTLRAGTVTAVIGVNGAGKSTLLRAVSGVVPTTGVVRGARVAYVAQDPEHQFLGRTAGADAALGATRDVAEVLATFDLTDHADRDPFRLSGGEQRRLALAGAVASGRDVIALDEPTSGLDRRHARDVLAAIDRHAAAGGAAILTSHDLTLVAENADDVVVLHEGRVVARGAPDDVLPDAMLGRFGLTVPALLHARRTAGLRADGTPARDRATTGVRS